MCLYRAVATLGFTIAIGISACGRNDAGRPAATSAPQIQTRELEYQLDGTDLSGYVAWDASQPGKRPGVLVVHEWWGHNDHARNQARRLAEAGYVGFALDMYGAGRVTTHPDTAQAFMSEAMKDSALLLKRFAAALQQLKQDPNTDADRIAAIGYCFGGHVVLSAARSGVDLDAVVTFHAGLIPGAIDSGTVKTRVLVQTGGADPLVPATAVERFRQDMTAAGVNFEIVTYPGVKHSFTNPDADSVPMDGLGYDAQADRQSWDAMLTLFQEIFP